MLPSLDIPTKSQVNWRVAVDRAWRSASYRREFEHECGLEPLGENPNDQARQAFDGHAKAYEDRFLIWATKKLGLEHEAPAFVRTGLEAERNLRRDE